MATEKAWYSLWIKRNWKWFVPVVVIFCAGFIFFSIYLLKSSDIYKQALERAQTNKMLIEYIGEPIKPGFFVAGKVSAFSSSISFPISGSKGEAAVLGIAKKSSGKWEFRVLDVTLEDGKIISLLSLEK